MARITIVTAGHLSTCPRMTKAADALAWAGHTVRVVSTQSMGWATKADADVRRTRAWNWTCVDHRSGTALGYRRGVRSRLASAVARALGGRAPWPAVVGAYAPVHPELVSAASSTPAELIYGGTTGALAAVAEAAARVGCPYAIDLEDLHTAESAAPDAAFQHALARRIERRVLPGAAFLTTSSGPIGDVYAEEYGVAPLPVHNVFPLPSSSPDIPLTDGPLRLYWVGQAVGPDRGLEEIVDALGTLAIPATLHVRGRETPFAGELGRRAAARAPALGLAFLPPVEPDRLVDSCRGYDIGLSGEPLAVESRRRCLGNKLFIYLLGGLAVVLTRSIGHQALIDDLGAGACAYAPGDVAGLVSGLRVWHLDRTALAAARRASWDAARTRWHWEHEAERGRLCALVAKAVS